MENQELLTSCSFRQEVLKIPAICKKLTNKTSKEKIKKIFDKYDFLISYNKHSKGFYELKANRLELICNALKSGTVKYNGGFFMISEILRIQENPNDITVFFKNGVEQSFSKKFEWLNDLF
jgi:hypothetical protein